MNRLEPKLINVFVVAAFGLLGGCQLTSTEPVSLPSPSSTTTSTPSTNLNTTSVLDRVKARGKLICGVNGKSTGFSYMSDKGEWSGFDVDFCRAIAAAVLGNPQAVEYKPVSVQQRFTTLQNSEIDVLLRNTTWTLSRNTENGISFAPPTFFDGQGIMIKTNPVKPATAKADKSTSGSKTDKADKTIAKSDPKSELTKEPPQDQAKQFNEELKELSGKTICVESGTSEANLKQVFKEIDVTITPIIANDAEALFKSYIKGECNAISSEKSQLAARRSKLAKPAEHKIFDATFSKEPFSPAVISNDDRWRNVVSWVIYSTFYAEELGINQKNYVIFKDTQNAEVTRFLGTSEALGIKLGLAPDWTTQVLKAVGNYEDIYARNLEPLGLPRGLNLNWKQGGLLYAMPFR